MIGLTSKFAHDSYDAFDRIASDTDALGWEIDYAYDAANRLTSATYPDGTTDQYAYDKFDLASYRDRRGRVWGFAHDADRRLIRVTDPLGDKTSYGSYEKGMLKNLIDPRGQTTTWEVDHEGRPLAKRYADSTATTYQYELARRAGSNRLPMRWARPRTTPIRSTTGWPGSTI